MPLIRELDRVECEQLLRGGSFGRFVLTTPRGADVLPVNYAVHDGAVVAHTSPSGLLATHADGAEVLFEVDEVDHEYWTGWSVVARGRAAVTTAEDDHADDDTGCWRRPRPWAAGDRTCEVRLAWTELTRRWVGGAR